MANYELLANIFVGLELIRDHSAHQLDFFYRQRSPVHIFPNLSLGRKSTRTSNKHNSTIHRGKMSSDEFG